jgi:Na+/phosphate symporter
MSTMAPQHIPHAVDVIVVGISTLTAALSSALLAQAPAGSVAQSIELQLLLLPLIGSLIISGGMIMLNPNPETRRVTIGRAMFALFFGVMVPQVVGLLHPSLNEVAVKPAVLVLAGGVISGLVYVLSKPFTRELYERAEGHAKKAADVLEERAGLARKD